MPTAVIAAPASDSSYHADRSRWAVPGFPWVPGSAVGTGLAGRPPERAGHTDQGQRHDGHHEDEGVGDHHPAEQAGGDDRDVPAPRRPVQDQPRGQGGHRGTDVPDGQQQDEDAHAQLRREHDPAGDEDARRAVAGRRAALGQQDGEHQHERVGERGCDVRHVRAEAADRIDQHVLGQFGRVEGHVRHPPAVQQQVAVQHVPRHEHDVRPVGVHRIGRGQPDVRGEQGDRGGGERGRPETPGQTAPPKAMGGTPGGTLCNRSRPFCNARFRHGGTSPCHLLCAGPAIVICPVSLLSRSSRRR